jgi:glycosyltransferase involved in cell wall biosynthesis
MDGIGWFTYNTLKYIVENNPDVEFHFLFDSGADEEFLFGPNVIAHNIFPPAKHAVLNIIWFEWGVRKWLKKIKPDIFFSPDGLLCLGWKGIQYGVMHDINFHHNPADLKWSNNLYYNFFFPKFARRAARLGTVSNFSKMDIVNTYGVDPDKIDVVYNGLNTFLRPLSLLEAASVRKELTGGAAYFVFIGTLHPRKNLVRLLEAFELFKKETNSSVKLVIVGKNMFKVDEIFRYQKAMIYGDEVIFTGRMADEKLNAVLGAAIALTFVPVFEGFGIPIIEAMQCDIPVICSNVTSMPEVADDAALLVNPFDTVEIKNAMVSIYSDENLRKHLIDKGRKRKKFFSWEKTASLLWESICKSLAHSIKH